MAGAVVVTAGLCGPATAAEPVWKEVPEVSLRSAKETGSLAVTRPGEAWISATEGYACLIYSWKICTWDAAVKQWTGGRWVDRKPPNAWLLDDPRISASSPTNVWLFGTRFEESKLARWNGTRWIEPGVPECARRSWIQMFPVGASDAWLLGPGQDCLYRYHDGVWTPVAVPDGDGYPWYQELRIAGPDDIYFRADYSNVPRFFHWDGTAFTEYTAPPNATGIELAGSSGQYYKVSDDPGLLRVHDGVTTRIPKAPSQETLQPYYVLDAAGDLYTSHEKSSLRWDGTAWRASDPAPGGYVRGLVPVPDRPGAFWSLGGDTDVLTTEDLG